MPILSRSDGTVRKWECAYGSSGGNMFLLSVSNMTKFIIYNYLRPILGHLRPKYVILLNIPVIQKVHTVLLKLYLCTVILSFTWKMERVCLPPFGHVPFSE
jgi:hypothetical protein